jgi:catechol 2,3-dioxygenase-like lactoylglutathione lyase family enzyme
MARGLDHVVHAVRDLEAAEAFYRRLGFTVGARNRHPWGTHNRLVQLPGFFVELLAVAEPKKIVAQAPGKFSFGAFNRDFLGADGEGLSCLVLESTDPGAEKTTFDAAGFGSFELLNFSRAGKRADGSDTEVGFSIAFARDPDSPHTAFFTCLQKRPENFWSPDLQRHENGARAIAACALVAENPSDHHVFLETFTGMRAPRPSSLGLRFETPRGVVLALDPRGFADMFGREAPHGPGLRIAALSFAVGDLAEAGSLLERNAIAVRRHREKLVIGPDAAFGAVLAFEAS